MRSNLKWFLNALQTHNSDECLIWPFSTKGPEFKTGGGYGQIRFEGKLVGTHRLAFRITRGRWPRPFACHSCDVRRCFNPRHIFEGASSDNVRDCITKGRHAKGETQGHSKLNENDVRTIRAVYIPNHPEFGASALGRKFGVYQQTVSKIVHRLIWQHI